MPPSPFRKSRLGVRPNSLKQPKPLPAIPTPNPEVPFPVQGDLPVIKYEEKKKPEESGVRLKTSVKDKSEKGEKTWEEEKLENKLAELKELLAYLDKFAETWKSHAGDGWEKLSDDTRWQLLDADEQWDLREKLIRVSALVAENESEAIEKQGARTADLLRFIPAARSVNLTILEMFKDKLALFIDKAQKELKNIRQDGVDYIAA